VAGGALYLGGTRFENLTFSHRFPRPSHRQQSALVFWCQRASSFLVLPKNFLYSHWIGEKLSRGKARF